MRWHVLWLKKDFFGEGHHHWLRFGNFDDEFLAAAKLAEWAFEYGGQWRIVKERS
jgi:hypothetical protein